MLELQRQPIAEGAMAMTEAEICERVLGQKSGYVKGLGFGPKSISSSKSRPSSSEREIELEHRLVETQQQQLETQQDRIDQLEALEQKKKKTNNIINNLKKYCVIYDQAKGPHDPFFYDVHMMDVHFFFFFLC